MDFNIHKDTYTNTINQSTRFSGKNHDFFTQVKASFLQQIIEKMLTNTENPSLIDIGCGHGFIHKHFKNSNIQITGVEIASEVLSMARQINPEVLYLSYNGETLPFPSQQFDIAITI